MQRCLATWLQRADGHTRMCAGLAALISAIIIALRGQRVNIEFVKFAACCCDGTGPSLSEI